MPILTHLIQQIIKTGKIPSTLKISTITPVYKKGDKDAISNYRPIGTMSVIEKIIEKYLEIETKKYIKENNILPNFQHGFQANKSTMTLLDEFSNIINTAMDNRKFIVLSFLDLRRAFETIDTRKLLEKLKKLGIKNKVYEDFFTNRKQITKIGTSISDEIEIEHGLGQGNISSPNNYNIYTSDIKYVKLKGQLKMFADDSCIISIHKSLEIALENTQNDLINIQKYFYNNNIYINDAKTEIMVLGTPKNREEIMSRCKIYIHARKCLEQKKYNTENCECLPTAYSDKSKYLGMYLENDFKFKEHTELITKKLRIINYQIRKIEAEYLPNTIKKNIYYALVESLLRYGATLYVHTPKYMMTPLISIQNHIKKYLFKCEEQRNRLLSPIQLSTLMYITKYYFEDIYKKKSTNIYNTRNTDYEIERANTLYGERMLSHIIPKLLNKYCKEYDEEYEDKNSIKYKIKEQLIEENKE